ncbi:MAG: histidine kinase [Chitinophagaceae bacterium]
MLGLFTIFVDEDGIVYAGTGSRGFVVFNPKTNRWTHMNLDPLKPDVWEDRIHNTVLSFAPHFSDRSKLWLGTFDGIYLFDKTNRQLTKDFRVINPAISQTGAKREYYDVQKMEVLNDSIIWFSTWGSGICDYNIKTGIATAYLKSAVSVTGNEHRSIGISSFVKLRDNLFFIGVRTWHSVLFNYNTKKAYSVNRMESEKILDWVSFVTKDRKENIWLIRNSRLYTSIPAYSRIQATDISRQLTPDNSTNELRGIYYDSVSQKYYGAVRHSSGVYVFDSIFRLVEIIPTPLFTNYYTYKETCTDKITKDGSGRFWTTGHETYIRLPHGKKFDYIRNVLPSLKWIEKEGEFDELVTTRKGDILIGSEAHTYIINHKTLQADTISLPKFVYNGNYTISASSFFYDSVNSFIYLANSKGVMQHKVQTGITRNLSDKAFLGADQSGFPVVKITLDDKGNIWALRTTYGVRIIDPISLKCIDSFRLGSRGLKPENYTNIVNGGNDLMFLKGENGIVVYNYKKQQSLLFDNSNGLIYPNIHSLLYCHGHLIAGESDKLLFYNTALFDSNSFTLQPRLNHIFSDTAVVYQRETKNIQSKITLRHNQNNLRISFSAPEFIFPERIEYAYQLWGVEDDWQYATYFKREVSYAKLSPGKYIFRLKAQMQGGNWEMAPVNYTIIISPAWWQTTLFKILSFTFSISAVVLIIQLRIQFIRRKEKQKLIHEKELLELEAKALRAQMNPHFIFNCLNSIKSLIQDDQKDKSVEYLATFSKLIRTLFNNADRKEITLFDEIETCKLYLQLEAMRFNNKLSFAVNIDENIDLKSLFVPALIIQPFIENAIWHGIVPKEGGGTVLLNVLKEHGTVKIVVDDNGIGRVASQQNKSGSSLAHLSKGVNLTQSRLELDNLLKQRQVRLEMVDKKNENGIPTGTVAIITLASDSEQ